MTLRKSHAVITVVCALAGAGLLAGRGWAEGPGPLDLGDPVVVAPHEGPLPPATARPVPPSPMTPASPRPSPVPTKSASPSASASASASDSPTGRAAPKPVARQTGGRPVQTLPPPRSTEEVAVPELSEDEEDEEEEGVDGGGGGSGDGPDDDGDGDD
ncbi:hypothetical protein [Streptomyces sp. NPDC020141]|uniref:hypothetical protein n=1 Tax=Streptomyces sp. NPDC020141 TaxID=3365065 RepID=UPI003796904E